MMNRYPSFLDTVWFTHESHFHLQGQVSSRNAFLWDISPPTHTIQRPLHSPKRTAWVVFGSQGIIGPLWLTLSMKKGRQQQLTVSATLGSSTSFLLFFNKTISLSMKNCLCRMAPHHTPQTEASNSCRPYSSISWSVNEPYLNGHLNHRPQSIGLFSCGDI